MLTPIKILDAWNAFAARHGLSLTPTPDGATTPHLLVASGAVGGRSVTFRYERRSETTREPVVDFTSIAAGLAGHGSTIETVDVRRVSYALSAATTAPDGALRVERDPSPTLRRVAALVGAGDPEVGDADFDRRFLITAEGDAAARALLTPALRRALTAADVPGAAFTCGGGRAEWRCDAVTDADAALEAALAVLLAVG